MKKPVISCERKPVHAHGSAWRVSFATEVFLNAQPRSRKSKIEVEPTSATIPIRCSVSMAGNSHIESRMAADMGVFSSDWHQASRSTIGQGFLVRTVVVTCSDIARQWKISPQTSRRTHAAALQVY